MKTIYKNLVYTALSSVFCVLLAIPANAQRNNNGGGGGGSHPTGGGGGSSSARPAGGGSSSSARPAGGGGGSARISSGGGVSRPSVSPAQRSGVRVPVYVDRQGNIMHNNNAGRVGVAAQNGAYAPRTAVVAPRVGISGTYRSAPASGYGHGYWGTHNYYHLNHGYYNSYYLPRLGFSIGVLPYGYYPFYFGDYQYFYSDGLYYQYNDSQYTVVEPPVGAEITTLPDNAQSIVINGQQYYELNGVYYQPVTKDDGTIVYQIAGKDGQLNTTDPNTVQDQQPQGPQMGDIVNQLPPDCRKIKVNGSTLYVSADGVYYQPMVDANGNTTYKIVGLPSDEPDQN